MNHCSIATVWLISVTTTSIEAKSCKDSVRSFTLRSVAFYAPNTPYFIRIAMLLLVKVPLFYVLLRRKNTFLN